MALNDTSKINISLKKLSGKAQTSNDKGLANEGLPSGITLSHGAIFGQKPPASPTTTNLYDKTDNITELVRFPVSFITGTDTSDGRHAFELKLPSDYQSASSNSKKGTLGFTNSAVIQSSNSKLQLVPASYDIAYEAKPFYGGSGTKNSGTQIPLLDSRDWVLDYYNGILYQQDPPGTGDHANNPDFVEAFLYIGNYLDSVISSSGGGGIERYYYIQGDSTVSAETDITISGMDFTGRSISNTETTVYLNGQMLLGGTTSQVASGAVDYAFNNNTQIRFSFAIEEDDQIMIFHTTTSFSTGKPVLLHQADAAFDEARIITAGDGITITTSNPTEFIISNSGLIQRTKNIFSPGSTVAQNDIVTVGFGSVTFATVSYADARIDIFLNGVLKFKGDDYYLNDQNGSVTASQFQWKNSTSIQTSDKITVIIF